MKKYDSYKDSGVEWIGEVPGEWNVKRLDHFFTERKDKVDDVSYPPLSVTTSLEFTSSDIISRYEIGSTI